MSKRRRAQVAGQFEKVSNDQKLDNVITNLELMPLHLNQRKNSHLGARQRDRAQKLFESEC